ncbi:two-component sensor histidine kinase [Burkholderia sp. SRS-46]|nr:two-component sensor histidine kinase [Burkholderia sp. SRS-46]
MSRARSWAIATRLTMVFAVSVAAIQLGASVFLYWSLKQDILQQDESALAEHIREVRLVMSGDGPGQPRVPAPPRWESHVLARKGIFVRLLDATGRTLTETPGLTAPPTAFPAPAAAESIPASSARWHSPTGGLELMLMSARVDADTSNPTRIIQAAMDLSDSERQFIAYRHKLVSMWLGVVLAAIGIGYVGIRRELLLVRRIAQAAGRINAEHFDERLGDAPMPAELKELAQAFDAMVLRLRRSFEQLSRFSSDLAHEFRTPLNNLMSAASVTLSRARTTAEYKELVERSMEEYDVLSRMIEAMLFLARTENQQTTIRPQRIGAAEQFGKLIDFFEALADEQGITLTQAGDAQLVADPALLRRALSNLVANALRHSTAGQSVTLEAGQASNGDAVLRVVDTGEGIAAQHLPHLFERFYRVDPARSEASTGLGLAIVKTIIALHRGTVEVTSRPGLGTTFTIRLPGSPPT